MLKKLIVASVVTAVAMAQAPTPKLDVKERVQKFIDTAVSEQEKRGGWLITERKKDAKGESFVIEVVKPKDEANSTQEDASKMDDLIGLKFDNKLEYSSDTLHAVSLLTAMPESKALTKKNKELYKQIVEGKLVEITTDYSAKDGHYSIGFKDVKERLGEVDVFTKGFGVTGIYDSENSLNQTAKLQFDTLRVKPLEKKYLGEYLNVDGIYMNVGTAIRGEVLDMTYSMGVKSIDANISKDITDIKALNLELILGGIDVAAYKALEAFGKENPTASPEDPELQKLSMALFTGKDIFVEIKDLSVADLVLKGENIGSGTITAKVSLEGGKDLAQKIAINPLMALSALNVTARIELSDAMLKIIMKDKRAAMLGMLPLKKEKEMVVYDIHFTKGKLTVNGKQF